MKYDWIHGKTTMCVCFEVPACTKRERGWKKKSWKETSKFYWLRKLFSYKHGPFLKEKEGCLRGHSQEQWNRKIIFKDWSLSRNIPWTLDLRQWVACSQLDSRIFIKRDCYVLPISLPLKGQMYCQRFNHLSLIMMYLERVMYKNYTDLLRDQVSESRETIWRASTSDAPTLDGKILGPESEN